MPQNDEHQQDIPPLFGELLPDFALPSVSGRTFTRDDLLVRGCGLLVYYRGRECPACVRSLDALAETWPDLDARKVNVVAVSGDPIAETRRWLGARSLYPFTIAEDGDGSLARAVYCLGENGERHHGAFLIDSAGTVRWLDRGGSPYAAWHKLSAKVDWLNGGG